MRFLRPDNERLELTYNDVFLLPQYSDIPSRMDVDVAPVSKINLQIPIVLSNMTSVAGRRMAETVARRGGLVVFTQDASFDRIEKMVAFVKKANIKYDTPIILKETDTIQTALNLILKRAHKAVIIVDDENHPIGIFKEKDKDDKDLFTLMKDVMSRELITIPEDLAPKEIFYILDKHRLSIAPVVDKENKLVGVITKKGAVRLSMYNPAVNENNQLLTAVAVRAGGDVEQSVNRLLEIGVDVIVVDTAHGHQKKMIEAVKGARRMAGNDFPIVAGNVVTQEGAQALIDAGASIVKVGVGPGAVCTTRMMTGVGRPQFSAVHRVA
ncbi:CBS domain-containing protein, partial [Candidatus Parcubacteria bacterium]